MEQTTKTVAFLGIKRKIPAPIVLEAIKDKSFPTEVTFPEADMERVYQVMVTCDIPAQGFYRARLGLEIGGVEVFPQDMELRCLMTGEDCPPEQRFITIDRARGTGKIKFILTDTDHPEANTFEPYKVNIYFLYDLKTEQKA